MALVDSDFHFRWRRQSVGQKILWILCYLLFLVVTASCIIPLAWMLSTSLKRYSQIFEYPPSFIPRPVTLESYNKLFTAVPFLRYFLNTVICAVTVTASQLLFSSLAAYSFARLEYPGRDKIFMLYLCTMMIPGQVTLITQYVIVSRMHLINTYGAIIVPVMFGSAYGTFLLRQFFMTLPKELEDAARIDGCNKFRIYGQIILPLSHSAMITLGIFVFLWQWNDMMWPLLVINSEEMRPMALGLTFLSTSLFGTDWALLMAGACVCVGPVIILYAFCQRFFIEGIVVTGMK